MTVMDVVISARRQRARDFLAALPWGTKLVLDAFKFQPVGRWSDEEREARCVDTANGCHVLNVPWTPEQMVERSGSAPELIRVGLC